MKNSLCIGLLLLSSMLIFNSCQKIVTITLPEHEPKIVVFCTLHDNSSEVTAWVSSTVGILDTRPISQNAYIYYEDSIDLSDSYWISNATVKLYENEVLIATLSPDADKRIYQASLSSPLNGQGNSYRLEISADGFETVEASTNFPKDFSVNNARVNLNDGFDEYGDPSNSIRLDLQDHAGLGNYYNFKLAYQSMIAHDTTDTLIEKKFIYINSSDPKLEYGDDGFLLLSDSKIDGENYPLKFDFNLYQSYDTIVNRDLKFYLTVDATDESYYFYQKSLYSYYEAMGNPFAEPAILYSNVKNGRGFFTIKKTSTLEIIP